MLLREVLRDRLPPEKLRMVPRGFEVIGDVAIIMLREELESEKHVVAEAIREHRKDVKTVLLKRHKVSGFRRTAGFEVLCGGDTETLHRENGCVYRLDVREVYFSSRLGFERARITSQVQPGERVLVPFCGIGPYLVPAAKKAEQVIGVEKNKTACWYLKENIALNKVGDNTDVLLADVSDLNNLLNQRFDRIILPTPYGADHFLTLAAKHLRPGGALHFFTFKTQREIPGLIRWFETIGLHPCSHRRCGSVAAGVYRYVFDLVQQD